MNAIRIVTLVLAVASAPACLVLSVNPVYDDESLTFDEGLTGTWQDADDKASLQIDKGEWKSYRVHYVHPSESGDLTGYLTILGNARFLDVMPARGEDRGSFVVPVHAILKVELDGDRLELTPLSYDWLFDRLQSKRAIGGLNVALDQKKNVLLVSPTSALRTWVRAQPPDGPTFGASAVFTRKARSTGMARNRCVSPCFAAH